MKNGLIPAPGLLLLVICAHSVIATEVVFPFKGSNEQPDHSQLNIDYFKRLDRVIDYHDQKGIVAHLMIYVWNKRVNWPQQGVSIAKLVWD